MKINVYEKRVITVVVETDDKEKAIEYARKAYEDNKTDNTVMYVTDVWTEDAAPKDTPDIYLDEDGCLMDL